MDDRSTLTAAWPEGTRVNSSAHLWIPGEPPIGGKGRSTGNQTFTVSLASEDFQRAGLLLGVPIMVDIDTPQVQLEAEMTQSTVMAHITVCALRIRRWIVAPPHLPHPDRRATPRARAPRATEVVLTTIPKDPAPGATRHSASGELKDVSAGGAGVRLPRPAYERLGSATQVGARFELPGSPGPLTLTADLVNSHIESATHVFMGYRWAQPVDPEAVAVVETYVRTTNSG
ncbi:MAG: PilZ domain-containing protein [Actinomycetia bacterium]|nr:PilZ domain-containing protein [Actinomycetes bacterium]